MAFWKIVATMAACAIPAASQAQDPFPVMDWNAWGTTAAANSVIEDAGRRGSGSYKVPQTRPGGSNASAAKARRQCATARGQAADGMRDPRLTQLLSLGSRAGY
jgi:transcription elongation factor